MLVLFADTDTDMTPAIAEKYGYRLISMPYSIDGVTVYPYEDFDTFDSDAYYEKLRGGVLPTTSAISAERYLRYFEPVMQNGDDILYVHFSAAMSTTFTFMEQAVETLRGKYPERSFYQIDTKGISICSLHIAEEIGDLYLAGKSAEEILAWAKTGVDHIATYFYADDLRFFRRSGRVSGLTAAMGTLLGVRPIIYMNGEGSMVSIGKERGRTRALERLLQYVAELGDDVENHRILIANSGCYAHAAEAEALLRARFGDGLHIEHMVVNPTSGAHCGPNCVGVSFNAIHR